MRSTHQAVSWSRSISASPFSSPYCQGWRPRKPDGSYSGMRKSRSRRVAKRMSPMMRETRKVRSSSSSRSRPIRYQEPASGRRAYGLTVRSRVRSREIDQYMNRTVRCLEIAPSSFVSRPDISSE